ncbi:VOC family protein [Shewanella gelidii]|uniref:VOC domain-containing protein n=1 Tax=Shewanella gelidii TaxID=1642821 RepID=A0A917JIS0_9GAMM|nr:VOC family protein [Shewanella gelidii]MCL1096938.1 VOC family protein [Shewanella gelidii]GGI71375.1 hypothetical protein GCM10009332_05830 [Shewanella gelidii]
MFSHIMVGTDDVQVSKAFYDAVLGTLGIKPGMIDEQGRCFYMDQAGIFAVTPPLNGQTSTCGNGSTIGFSAQSPEQVDAWHAAGVQHGGTTCEAPPGIRQAGVGPLYLAYLRDPFGNKICALHRVQA